MERTASFGYWVRRRRKALDLTQAELAQRVGCADVTIRRIEADERRPSRQIAERLADCLTIPELERAAFLRAARAELAADQLAVTSQPLDIPADTAPTAPLPTGTVTFLFTDIVGSTRLWEQHAAAMRAALARHNAILRETVESHGGVIFKTVGDGICAAFASAPHALTAALTAQRTLSSESWADSQAVISNLQSAIELRVRMALHTGTAEIQAGDYTGFALSRAARILAAGHGGQVLLSLATQELVRNHLPSGATLRELGTYRLKDLSRPEQLFQLVASDLPNDFPALRSLENQPTNLPAQPTALIGREREIVAVCALLRRPDVRLVTLTGPGGTGKTRLALQVAAELVDDPAPPLPSQRELTAGGERVFPDGVWFVNLAPIRDQALVVTTIAQALGVMEAPGKPLEETLRAVLRARRTMLLLDNFEQILDAAPQIAELLAAAPGLKVLATSRETLHISGEHEFAVPPLALPPTTDQRPTTNDGSGDSVSGDPAAIASTVETITQYEAVRLFIARAQAAKADFMVTNDNAPAVAEICHRLDGLPLAIELAAARIKLFPPEALLARLGNRLQVLTGGPRDLPARQQTLRNTIDWSYELLSAEEQTLFRRLGVFVGGSTLEAIVAVGAELRIENEELRKESNEQAILHSSFSILHSIEALVDKSLLRQGEGVESEPRFEMLETVREYALERLAASNELATIQRRHAEFFMELAERADPELWKRQQVEWLQRLEIDHDNMRAALEWSYRSKDTNVIGVRLAAALGWFWLWRGYRQEGYSHLKNAAVSATDLTLLRGRALHALGILVLESDIRPARALFEESLAISRSLGDIQGQADSLCALGWLTAITEGTQIDKDTYFGESLALYQRIDHTLGIARVLSMSGDQEQREASLVLYRSVGHLRGCADALSNLGRIAHHQDDSRRAMVLLQEALDLYHQLQDEGGELWALLGMSDIYLAMGDHEQAAALIKDSLVLARKLNDRMALGYSLNNLGEILLCENAFIRASYLFDESLAIFR
ncbi:MAG TPA: tetratricopeptide repeat protein, partial [Roseiflexaceae bacterium]|nr:tetratricopeptide repeat protein [Roseiflexaceae bacterium]